MAKVKYYYDQETLSYRPLRVWESFKNIQFHFILALLSILW